MAMNHCRSSRLALRSFLLSTARGYTTQEAGEAPHLDVFALRQGLECLVKRPLHCVGLILGQQP